LFGNDDAQFGQAQMYRIEVRQAFGILHKKSLILKRFWVRD
jgi:hypothetical protein